MRISTAADLKKLADDVKGGNTYLGKTVVLTGDIDLSDYANWEPIGINGSEYFGGQFDGGGFTITGLKINRPGVANQGLFGYVKDLRTGERAQVKNVMVKGASVVGKDYTGVVVGYYGTDSLPLEGCAMVGGSVSGAGMVGGVVGVTGSPVTACYATGSVTGTGADVGGVVGVAGGNIIACYATGSVTSTGAYVGGVVGRSRNRVTDCVALNPTVSGSSVGRVVGSYFGGGGNFGWSGMALAGTVDAAGAGTSFALDSSGKLAPNPWAGFTSGGGWKPGTATALPTLAGLKGSQSSALPSWLANPATTTYITSAEDLKKLADAVNGGTDYSGQTVLVTKDINLSVLGTNWTPIGTRSNPFAGQFDGGGFTITGLKIDSTSEAYQGLFGMVQGKDQDNKAQVKNVTVKGASVKGRLNIGGVVGWYGTDTNPLENCAMVGGSVTGIGGYAGGVVGNASGPITACYATGSVGGNTTIGGVVGNASGPITACYATGSVTGTGSSVGGVVGYASGPITACYATGSVGDNSLVGGVVGYASGPITACYATSSVTGTGRSVGGVAGEAAGTVTGCVALNPQVKGSANVGPLVGDGRGTATITGSYRWSGMEQEGGGSLGTAGTPLFVRGGFLESGGTKYQWDGFGTPLWTIDVSKPSELPALTGVGTNRPTFTLMQQRPGVDIDFVGGRIAGLQANKAYSIFANGTAASADTDANGTISIQESWFGTGVSILVGPGTAATDLRQICDIPARPAVPPAPTTTSTPTTLQVTNPQAGVEYSVDKTAWNTTGTFTGLTSGTTYTLWARQKATSSSFASLPSSTTVTLGLETYVIKASAGAGGTISPSGSVQVTKGKDQTFAIAPDAGYTVADVKVDGASLGAKTTYTFSGVTAGHTISATFRKTGGTAAPAPGRPASTPMDSEARFWRSVQESINAAEEGDVLKIDASPYANMPDYVMVALDKRGVGLVIAWQGGKTVTIPGGKAQGPDGGQIYWPISLLAQLYQGIELVEDGAGTGAAGRVNPETGGYSYRNTATSVTTPVTGTVSVLAPLDPLPGLDPLATPGADAAGADALAVTSPVAPANPAAGGAVVLVVVALAAAAWLWQRRRR